MNNKIIGFTISSIQINHSDIDVFSSGLKTLFFKRNNLYVYFWGFGDLNKCCIDNNTYSLSFPLTNSLDDSNVLIVFSGNKIIIKNDWLGSIPVYYSEKSHIVSTLINKVINTNDIKINGNGFNNYLEFGYSVFGQTPVDGVKFLLFYSEIVIGDNIFEITRKSDDVFDILTKKGPKYDSDAVLNKIKDYINNVENFTDGNILIPTSGGYDSRLLNLSVKNKDRIRSFTYGVSRDQDFSYETVKAKFLTNKLGIKWKQIILKEFNKYDKEWFFLYGCSTHLHGMYHIEFYKKIKDCTFSESSLLSGIIGDAWSGNVKIGKIKSYRDVIGLGYSHGISFDSCKSLFNSDKLAYKKFFAENKENLNNHEFRIITSMRFKIILLSYLMKIPDYFGFLSWTPFLNKDIALSMLLLPEKDRNQRHWQKDFFKKNDVDIENVKLNYSCENSLDIQSISVNSLDIQDLSLLEKFFKKGYIYKIYKKYLKLIVNVDSKKIHSNSRFKLIEKVENRLRQNKIKYYYMITILKSIELTLKLK